ncbi:uncharacterized protein LOC123541262 [Mercenaria mercenaria]|uniref:uncharacterized protein LOC123541262 n=1 Tax=Mercenaria mercenaria TaxID=6596 RepID=UPI00234E8BD9|nr:uncharacterized protein LOC123541262 [Mercenaria mercenaria]XP_053382275.1 uncharacterized protein LOC123541262 [Mercenaria mercenaria]
MGTSNTKFTVGEDCYPRYIFMKNQVNDLLKRDRKLWEKLGDLSRSDSLINNEGDDTIIVHVFQSSFKQVIDEQDILICKGSCKRTKAELNDEYLESRIEKHRHYSLPRTAYILLQQTIGQTEFTRRIAVAQNKADRDALSKRLKRKDFTVCLKESISEEICKLLERNVFHRLKKRCEYISSRLKDAALGDYEKPAERLVYDMVGLYNRSHVPEHERPELALQEKNKISAKLLQDFRKVSKKISWCGYYDSTLYVFVDEGTPSMILCEDIEEVLRKHKISKYKVESSLIKPFASCPSGSKAEIYPDKNDKQTKCFGTVAGYVRSDTQKHLYALIPRHLSVQSDDGKVYISKGKCSLTGETMVHKSKNIAPKGEQRSQAEETMGRILDVAAASIDRNQEKKCDFSYKTEDNDPVPGKLCEYKPYQLQGLFVHTWGASSTPGLGRVAIPELKSVHVPRDDGSYIAVADRDVESDDNSLATTTTPFCKEGDSGSMVLTHDPDTNGKKVQLISMVIGKNLGQDRLYTTVKLKDGLAQIETEIGEKVSLC